MTCPRQARFWAQLGYVANTDAMALLTPHGFPTNLPSDEDMDESDRLMALADEWFDKAAGYGFSGGTDAAFGDDCNEGSE